jgi:multimeric flavodoxin WrbA
VEVVVKLAADADENDLLACDAVCLGTPDYHNYMAGMLKDFLDRTYYPTEVKVTGKPYGAFVTHGGDGLAAESVATVCGYFKFKRVAETVSVFGRPNDAAEKELRHLGAAMSERSLGPVWIAAACRRFQSGTKVPQSKTFVRMQDATKSVTRKNGVFWVSAFAARASLHGE